MPWSHCGETINDDQSCPVCAITKEQWTIEWRKTRVLRVSGKKALKVRLWNGEDLAADEPIKVLDAHGDLLIEAVLDEAGYAKLTAPGLTEWCQVVFPDRALVERVGDDPAGGPTGEPGAFVCTTAALNEFRIPVFEPVFEAEEPPSFEPVFATEEPPSFEPVFEVEEPPSFEPVVATG